MEAAAGRKFSELRVDGGAAANDLLMEIQASLSKIRLRRPAYLETTAFGACRMAMLGSGQFKGLDDLPRLPGKARLFVPGQGVVDRQTLLRRWQIALERSKAWTAS